MCRTCYLLVSTYVVCERLSVKHKRVSGWTVNFKFSRKPLSGISDQKATLPPISENFKFIWPKFTPEYPPFQKTSELRWPKFTPEYPPPISENFRIEMIKVYSRIPPHFGKLQNWDDQSLLRNTPPRFEMTKVYSGIPPSPISENFRIEMTKVYSGIPPPPPPPFRKMREVVCGD